MAVTLCFDFGNTRLKCGIFRDGVLEDVVTLENEEESVIAELVSRHNAERSILSSVIHHRESTEKILQSTTKFHKVSYHSRLPLISPVAKPETIGSDRLAMLTGALQLFPDSNLLVIGLGSAITYNFINPDREFLGGGISPGMAMRFRSLHELTAHLPLIKYDWNFPLIGYDTKTNILSGVVLGMATEIDGTIDLYREKYRNLNVVLTGGDSAYFACHLKNQIFADLNLIFKGLYAICELNNE